MEMDESRWVGGVQRHLPSELEQNFNGLAVLMLARARSRATPGPSPTVMSVNRQRVVAHWPPKRPKIRPTALSVLIANFLCSRVGNFSAGDAHLRMDWSHS